jgi:hypothetical protein
LGSDTDAPARWVCAAYQAIIIIIIIIIIVTTTTIVVVVAPAPGLSCYCHDAVSGARPCRHEPS